MVNAIYYIVFWSFGSRTFMLFSNVLASTSTGSDSVLMSLFPLGIIFLVFYIFVIRPQNKKVREHQAMLDALKTGDSVVTSGGISGLITKIDEKNSTIHLQIADGVVVKVLKSFILEKK